MIVYKVVDRKTRYGSNVSMWLNANGYKIRDFKNHVTDKKLWPYILKYEIGSEVKAAPDSPGIMCFYTRKDAESFLKRYFYIKAIIIEVEGRGLIHYDKFWGRTGCGTYLTELKASYDDEIYVTGLVTFEKVTVLN